MTKIHKDLSIFIIGGIGYIIIELIARRYSHWTMFLAGGTSFVSLHHINVNYPKMPLWKKCILGSLIITSIELIIGCIANLWLNWNVWDYSNNRYNIWGQICLKFTILWGFLCIPIYLLSGVIYKKNRF